MAVIIVAGIIIGLLGRSIAPGDKDNIPIVADDHRWHRWESLIGFWIAGLLGVGGNGSRNRLAALDHSLVVAIVLVMITSVLLSRRGKSTTAV